ncbi:MAG: sugar transferase [Clostridia bacterium]|nr:sugar transferase [Clostridia bacterium]
MYQHFFKRVLDILLAILILLVPLPLYLVIAIAIKVDSKGPVLFKQERLGLGGRVFCMYKFRSMCVDAERMGQGVYSDKRDIRVTRVGRILRSTSIDELPQAINVLKGDMSFIGPRPPLTYHPWPLEDYTDEQRRMFDVRPGITGWAQIHGRKAIGWDERIGLSVYYVDHMSIWMDVKIFFLTIPKVLSNADNENRPDSADRSEE